MLLEIMTVHGYCIKLDTGSGFFRLQLVSRDAYPPDAALEEELVNPADLSGVWRNLMEARDYIELYHFERQPVNQLRAAFMFTDGYGEPMLLADSNHAVAGFGVITRVRNDCKLLITMEDGRTLTRSSNKCNPMPPNDPRVRQIVRDALAVEQQWKISEENRQRFRNDFQHLRGSEGTCTLRRDGESSAMLRRRLAAALPTQSQEATEDATGQGQEGAGGDAGSNGAVQS